jgi:hypothetical protein
LLEWKLLQRVPSISRKGTAVTFFVHASRGANVTVTARLNVVVAIAKGRSLLADGWEVFIIGPDGSRHTPSEFDSLLARASET